MQVSVYNRQKIRQPAVGAVRQLLKDLMRVAGKSRGEILLWRDIAVYLLDDAGIAPINQAVMGHAGDTDVITQRYDPLPGEPAGVVGEIFVNVERACRAAPHIRGWSADRELALYLAHGIDHLTGADDRTPAGYARMRRRELAWLRKLSLTPLFRTDKVECL